MFLTDPDPRAEVRGSRDPLGLVPLWSRFGRHLVGNLTTVTTSVRGFTTTLLGYHFAREAQDQAGPEVGSTLDLFLKFEQLAGYCRHAFAGGADDIRGIERVKKRLAERSPLFLSASREDQILSNQKVYGLWGLYSGPSRASSLLQAGDNVLLPAARQFIEEHSLKALDAAGLKGGGTIVALLRQPRAELHLRGRHARLAQTLGDLHSPSYTRLEREFYWKHLVLGGPDDSTRGMQGLLVNLMGKLPDPAARFDRADLRALVKLARQAGDDGERLSERLAHIDHLESVLAPAALAFSFLLSRNGQRLASVAGDIATAWGPRLGFVDVAAVEGLRAPVGEAFRDPAAGQRWAQTAAALASGDYQSLLRLLLEHNAAVMQSRSASAPWATVSGGRLDVRYRDERADLRTRDELPHLWLNPYFLNSLKAVRATLAA